MAEERKISQEELPHMPSTNENAFWKKKESMRSHFEVQEDEIMPVVQKSEKEVVPVEKEKRKPASFCKLFSMMDAGDALLLLIGTIGSEDVVDTKDIRAIFWIRSDKDLSRRT